MIRSTRFQPLLLMTLGLVVATLGCGSGGSAGSGGSGGAGGTNGGVLRILVTNDDGVGAEGIDAIVEALTADPNNDVTVCGPLTNQSGTGDRTDCATGNATDTTTQSGYPATAVDGCPADAVNYALDPANGLYAADSLPHVVISGINECQNVGEPVVGISGTVGAAKTAARDHGIPALASSQGIPGPDGEYDYPAGVQAVLAWLAEHRAALAAGDVTTAEIDSINIPSCDTGSIRGALEIGIAESSALQPQDCESTLELPQNDVEAFVNGYTTLSAVPAN
ncbi:MAG: survival protein SurE [Deltaproteobacteria bacterium]|nr:survival protein SurE [Deltaproteobacteria bacterium]